MKLIKFVAIPTAPCFQIQQSSNQLYLFSVVLERLRALDLVNCMDITKYAFEGVIAVLPRCDHATMRRAMGETLHQTRM
jgi:hypothetical protein